MLLTGCSLPHHAVRQGVDKICKTTTWVVRAMQGAYSKEARPAKQGESIKRLIYALNGATFLIHTLTLRLKQAHTGRYRDVQAADTALHRQIH